MNKSSRLTASHKVTFLGACVNSFLSAFQLSFGFIFHSNALVLDGFHSLSDLVTDVFVLIMTKVGGAKPDKEHPYGHGRFETMGVVALGSALITVAILLGWQNAERLLSAEEHATPAGWALLVPLAAIGGKEILYRHTMKVGKRINSTIIIANAWHHRSDALSSVVVFVGVGLASLGLPWMDSVAAIGVAFFIAKIGVNFVWDSIKELVDTALDEELVENIKKEISSVEGVKGIHNLRSRKVGDNALVDVNIEVEPRITVSEGHEIATRASKKIVRNFVPIADVTAHTDIEHDHVEGDFFTTSIKESPLPLRSEIEQALTPTLEKFGLWQELKKIQIHYIHKKVQLEIFFAVETGKRFEEPNLKPELRQELIQIEWLEKVDFWVEA